MSEEENKKRRKSLLDKEAPKGYTAEWIETLRSSPAEVEGQGKSVLVFRIEDEWLALPSTCILEIKQRSFVHKIPFRSDDLLLGLKNVDGELRLVMSLRVLLGFDSESRTREVKKNKQLSHRIYPRDLYFGQPGNDYVVPVDEIFGIATIFDEELEEAPINVSKSLFSFTKGIFTFKEATVGLLDEQLILKAFREKVL